MTNIRADPWTWSIPHEPAHFPQILHLDSPDSTVYESLIVQLSPAKGSTKDIIVGVIYKPPNTN